MVASAEVEDETQGEATAGHETQDEVATEEHAGGAAPTEPDAAFPLADPPDDPPEVPMAHSHAAADGTRQLTATAAPALCATTSHQGLAAAAMRDIGRMREINQDSIFALLTSLPREGGDVPIGLFVVADGMGGHEGGEVASRLAVRTIAHSVLAQLVLPALDGNMDGALQPMMVSAVQAANEAIWDSAQVAGTDMGTTCTAALLVGGSLYIAHVGDSRAYLFEPGGLRQLTTDHSTVGRLIQLGQLEAHEARDHPLRSQLYRTIGQQPQVMVDFIYQPIGASSHLLLCSDGLWGMVEEPLIQQTLANCLWPQDACHELIALANLAGGEDNIAAVVVSLPMVER
ncbi:protein phosphatase [Candidatus Viridilinea mediisalina]|uniref:Protein phosphatase n=2 Tax=Candidatus Viridilinea mediisalina TaxID=2024553 RepID=A0A2A6RHS4_9CHLR|nr:protein phosphatase [Candidatus Viridilinea mediisalina]